MIVILASNIHNQCTRLRDDISLQFQPRTSKILIFIPRCSVARWIGRGKVSDGLVGSSDDTQLTTESVQHHRRGSNNREPQRRFSPELRKPLRVKRTVVNDISETLCDGNVGKVFVRALCVEEPVLDAIFQRHFERSL